MSDRREQLLFFGLVALVAVASVAVACLLATP
jgi:hypothetical protein